MWFRNQQLESDHKRTATNYFSMLKVSTSLTSTWEILKIRYHKKRKLINRLPWKAQSPHVSNFTCCRSGQDCMICVQSSWRKVRYTELKAGSTKHFESSFPTQPDWQSWYMVLQLLHLQTATLNFSWWKMASTEAEGEWCTPESCPTKVKLFLRYTPKHQVALLGPEWFWHCVSKCS